MLLEALARSLVLASLAAAQSASRPLASSAPSASCSSPAPSGSAAGAGPPTTIQLPPLYTCDFSTWTYTAPVGPKYLGFYVSGTTSWIETFSLPPVYDDRTNGSFTWKCDLPAGLSVAAMFYVVQDGASGTQGAQASTPDAVIIAGSAGTSCLGTNDPGSQSKIYSLASSLDPAFSATSPGSQPSAAAGSSSGGGGGSGSSSTGAIVGGVVGGVLGVAALGCILIYLKRKHDKAAWAAHDGLSVYSGRSEKVPPFPSLGGPGGGGGAMGPTGVEAGLAPPPQGAYYASDANGRLHLVMGYPSQQDVEAGYAQQPTPPPLSPSPGAVKPMTAPPGTLPEPMDDSEEVASPANSARGRI
ncbi:hypothetical protein JCM8202v2_000799 [Rhodotorula sphaerocarpa]